MSNQNSEQLQNFLDVAITAAKQAGAVLEDFWGHKMAIAEKDRPGDLVTEADQKSENVILNIISSNFPNHGILAEESGKLEKSESDYLWVIDPLDGTTNYAHGYPLSAISIGLLIKGKPSVGVVYNPLYKELWTGALGKGATLNQRPIKVSETKDLSKSLLVTGFAYDRRETTDNNYAEFCYLTHLTQGVRRSGSASLDLVHVACGRFDAYWERGIKLWDIAAGIIILEEAGGKVSAYNGNQIDFNTGRILATNGHIHESLSETLQKTPRLSETFYEKLLN
jgi:myo-inositol-1(or 4)-monophosphatase